MAITDVSNIQSEIATGVEKVMDELETISRLLQVAALAAVAPELKAMLNRLAGDVLFQVNELETLPGMPQH